MYILKTHLHTFIQVHKRIALSFLMSITHYNAVLAIEMLP